MTTLPLQHTEAAILSAPFPDGSRRWQFQFDSDGELSFIQRFLRCLQSIMAGQFSPTVDDLIRDCRRHCMIRNVAFTSPSTRQSDLPPQQVQSAITPAKNTARQYSAVLKSNTPTSSRTISPVSKTADSGSTSSLKDHFGKNQKLILSKTCWIQAEQHRKTSAYHLPDRNVWPRRTVFSRNPQSWYGHFISTNKTR